MAVLATPRAGAAARPQGLGWGSGLAEGGEAGTREQEKRTYWGGCGGNKHCPPYPGSQWMVAHGTRHPCHHSEVTLSLSHPVLVLPSQILPSKPPESPSCGYTATLSHPAQDARGWTCLMCWTHRTHWTLPHLSQSHRQTRRDMHARAAGSSSSVVHRHT